MSFHYDSQFDLQLSQLLRLIGKGVRWLWLQLVKTNVVENYCWGKIYDHNNLMERCHKNIIHIHSWYCKNNVKKMCKVNRSPLHDVIRMKTIMIKIIFNSKYVMTSYNKTSLNMNLNMNKDMQMNVKDKWTWMNIIHAWWTMLGNMFRKWLNVMISSIMNFKSTFMHDLCPIATS
jgi:hypothetical protein